MTDIMGEMDEVISLVREVQIEGNGDNDWGQRQQSPAMLTNERSLPLGGHRPMCIESQFTAPVDKMGA